MTKEGILNYIRDLTLEAVDQPRKAVDAGVFHKDLEKVLEQCKELLRDTLVAEIQTHGKEGLMSGGYAITYNPGARRWKYQGEAYEKVIEEKKRIEEIAQLAHRTQKPVIDEFGMEIQPAIAQYDKEGVTFRAIK